MPLLRKIRIGSVGRYPPSGLAAPVGLPEALVRQVTIALQAVIEDPAFRDHADTSGFVADWRDGAGWTAEAHDEHDELAKLWATEPWLQEGTG